MTVNQNFVVKMELIDEEGNATAVAPELCKAIVGWEVEDLEEKAESDFLVPDSSSEEEEEEGSDEEDGEDEEDEDDEETESVPLKLLALTSRVTKEALAEFKALTTDINELRISFIYGNENVGQIVKQFDCDTDAVLTLCSGNSRLENAEETPLEVELLFDVYGSDTLF